MKIDRHGRAKILTTEEIQLLFSQGLTIRRDRALFGICLYTACRIAEACTLRRGDVYDFKRLVRPELIIRKGNTKGKLATRTIPVGEDLRNLLVDYNPPSYQWFLFPGRHGKGHINPDSAARILRSACLKVGIDGASTHSFRRTALTMMSDSGIPLRVIQEVSGHRTLDELQKYLEVRPEQVRGAIASLSMLSHVGKPSYDDLILNPDSDTPNQEVDRALSSDSELL
ncbi:tyrosine-type recombinase/integrase [Chlorogloea sp. CCALA 695]|uniref:tyrosine-type recombinase/integrase n=1 Tax=Chlorogloea sp. CCALA 695 TaxID=2107693 RepID=UPI000D06B353|nr:site-specific integrase [Chlorogloea sp. CCALA 695]PSB27651.1 integrase [Chlorogloea sp. CCALA 695]